MLRKDGCMSAVQTFEAIASRRTGSQEEKPEKELTVSSGRVSWIDPDKPTVKPKVVDRVPARVFD